MATPRRETGKSRSSGSATTRPVEWDDMAKSSAMMAS